METKKRMDNRKKTEEMANYKRKICLYGRMWWCRNNILSCQLSQFLLCLFTVISCLFVPHLSGHFIINHTTEPRPSQEPLQVGVFSVEMKPQSFCACVCVGLCGSFFFFYFFFLLFFTIVAKIKKMFPEENITQQLQGNANTILSLNWRCQIALRGTKQLQLDAK